MVSLYLVAQRLCSFPRLFYCDRDCFSSWGSPAFLINLLRFQEHHFIEVLQSLQGQKNANVSIPVPEIIDKSKEYEEVYLANFSLPKNLINIRSK